MANKKEETEELYKLLEKIKDKPVIVEGKNDSKALYSFGFKKIHAINGKGLYDFAFNIAEKEIIILTDFDKEGSQITKKLTLFLQANNCKVDKITRTKLKKLFIKNKINRIQDLKRR